MTGQGLIFVARITLKSRLKIYVQRSDNENVIVVVFLKYLTE